MSSTEVIIPYVGSDPHRERALEWVCAQLDGWSVRIASAELCEPWCKSRIVMPAIEACKAQIIVLHDADVYCPLQEAVVAVEAGARWAIPHRQVRRLSEAATGDLLAAQPFDPADFDRPPYDGTPGGGIVVTTRNSLLDIPLDPRFEGWGQEDMAFGAAMLTMLGRPWRGRHELLHLWHPPQPRVTRKWGSEGNRLLYQRYHVAIGKPDTMRYLVKEAHGAL